jgi:hypothetical protein
VSIVNAARESFRSRFADAVFPTRVLVTVLEGRNVLNTLIDPELLCDSAIALEGGPRMVLGQQFSPERWITMIRKKKYDAPALIKAGDFVNDTGNLKRGGFEPNIVLPLGA